MTALVVGGIGLGLPGPSGPPPSPSPSQPDPLADPVFSDLAVDGDLEALEPTISVAGNDIWISGMRNVGDELLNGNLWRVTGANVEHESPAVEGTGDAVIHVADDGSQYWAVMKPHVVFCNNPATHHKLNLGFRAVEGEPWSESPEFSDRDRPWFVRQPRGQSGDATVLTAIRWCTPPRDSVLDKHIWMMRRIDGSWVPHLIFDPPENITASFPQYLRGRTPAGADDPTLDRTIVPISTATGNTGPPEVVRGSVSYIIPETANVAGAWKRSAQLGNGNAMAPPWAAVDDAGRLYLVWIEFLPASQQVAVKFAHKANPRAWNTPFDGEFTLYTAPALDEIWALGATAGAEGRLAVAWYERERIGLSFGPWQARMRYAFNAHDVPTLVPSGGPKVIDATVTDAAAPGVATLRDFLTLARLSDGNLAIAFVCNHALQTEGCGDGGISHPRLARQTGGDNLNSPAAPLQRESLLSRLPIRLPPPPFRPPVEMPLWAT